MKVTEGRRFEETFQRECFGASKDLESNAGAVGGEQFRDKRAGEEMLVKTSKRGLQGIRRHGGGVMKYRK